MKDKNQYIIPINGLPDGSHIYTFSIDNDFFSVVENSEIKNGNINANITLNKMGKVMTLNIELNGEVTVPCDRCLDDLKAKVKFSEQLIVEYGEIDQKEAEDNVIFVSENNDTIDLKQHLFEYILLSLPYQRVHDEDNSCDPEMLRKIEELSSDVYTDEDIDPRWNELKKIKNGTS